MPEGEGRVGRDHAQAQYQAQPDVTFPGPLPMPTSSRFEIGSSSRQSTTTNVDPLEALAAAFRALSVSLILNVNQPQPFAAGGFRSTQASAGTTAPTKAANRSAP